MLASWVPTAVISASMFVCVTLFMTSCLACKRFFRKKKNLDEEEEKVDGVVLTKITDDKTETNGLTNIAYENEKSEEKEAEEDIPEQEEDIPKSSDIESESNDITPDESESRLEVASKEDPRKSRNLTPLDVCELSAESCQKEKLEEDSSLKEDQCEAEDNQDDQKEDKQEEQIGGDKNTDKTEQGGTNEFDEGSVKTPVNQKRFKDFSTSIRSNDIDDLSFVVNDISLRPASANEENSAPPIKADFSKFDDVCLQGGWRQVVKVTDLLELGLIDTTTADEISEVLKTSDDTNNELALPDQVKPYIFGKSPLAGILLSESGEKRSIFRSAKDGIIRRGTAISLLEAQAATGNIIDPITGRKMSVTEAFQLGLLDKVYETVVSRAERAVVGYKTRVTENTLSLGEAMEKGLVMESHGYRLLEAQLATGGIIDHKTNLRLPLNLAIDRGLLGSKMGDQLKTACDESANAEKPDDLKTFCDPNTEENVTYSELLRRSVVDTDTGMRLYPLEKIGRRRYSYGSYSGRSSLASSRASSKESIPAAVAAATSS